MTCCRLRALSGGGGSGGSGGGSSCAVASPPLSPALPKYKLADFRYGREEMLALYVKDNKVSHTVVSGWQVIRDVNKPNVFASLPQIPIDLHDKEFLPILQEEPLPPLALVSFTEEEQVGAVTVASSHQSVNLPLPCWPSWSRPIFLVREATKHKASRVNNQSVLSSSTRPPPIVFAEKFFHVCKQCSCNAADRARRWANCWRGTKRPKYLKR